MNAYVTSVAHGEYRLRAVLIVLSMTNHSKHTCKDMRKLILHYHKAIVRRLRGSLPLNAQLGSSTSYPNTRPCVLQYDPFASSSSSTNLITNPLVQLALTRSG